MKRLIHKYIKQSWTVLRLNICNLALGEISINIRQSDDKSVLNFCLIDKRECGDVGITKPLQRGNTRRTLKLFNNLRDIQFLIIF